jgi:hypothetical protein
MHITHRTDALYSVDMRMDCAGTILPAIPMVVGTGVYDALAQTDIDLEQT